MQGWRSLVKRAGLKELSLRSKEPSLRKLWISSGLGLREFESHPLHIYAEVAELGNALDLNTLYSRILKDQESSHLVPFGA